jgi:predicted  nucleic acid-binding Zn-ribbon protein
MEFLFEKASLSLFLQDQIERNEKRILEKISSDQELSNLINDVVPLKERLFALEKEVESDPNVNLLQEIIQDSKPKYDEIIEFKPNLFGIVVNIKHLVKTISRIMTS